MTLNPLFVKASKIILVEDYGFNDTVKNIARHYLNETCWVKDGTSLLQDEKFWDKIFQDILNVDYVLSVPMRLKEQVIKESRFHKYHDPIDGWIEW